MDKAEFQKVLQLEIDKTREAIEDYKRMTEPVAPDVAIGRISRMDAINNKAVNEAALRKAEEKLQDLERISGRIDEDGFGLCRKCGTPIPMQRLLLMPHIMFCVRCAN
jgi:DnaK suppressor protein